MTCKSSSTRAGLFQRYCIQKEEKFMTTNGESKFSYLFIALGLGLGAIGGLMFALLARKETRELLRERSIDGLDYLNQKAGKLRESAEVIVKKGKEFIGPH